MNWLFKQDMIQKDLVIKFYQKRVFTGKKNEKIIGLIHKNGKWFFSNLYQIETIKIQPIEDENEITIHLKSLKEFEDEEKPFEDYIYSLRRVTNFKNPEVHFRRKYNKIEDLELRAIVDDKIYFERTYFGVIINSLPKEHVKSFVQFLAEQDITLLLSNPDSIKAFQLLKDYLNFHIIKPAEILVDTGLILSDLIEEEYLETLAFSDDSPTDKNTIIPQIQIFKEIINDYQILLDEIGSDMNNISRLFSNHFKNSKLPIQL